jgi:ABC-type dipeptide/oligopeptide/nickel transport system ATPase component
MIFQEPKSSLVPYQTVEKQMAEAEKAASDNPGAYDRAKAEWLLNRMGFDDPARILRSYPHEISGGESQRATIAIVLQSEPELLLADEPTSSLDTASSSEVLELLDEVVRSGGRSLILVSHDSSVLAEMVERVVVMYAGNIVEDGPADSVLGGSDGAVHPYTKQLVAASAMQLDGVTYAAAPSEEKPAVGCPYRHSCLLKAKLGRDVQNRCEGERPELLPVGDDHLAACWGLME